MSVFPKEIYRAPRSWAERAYPKLIYFNELDRGCHFAAWQEPWRYSPLNYAQRSGPCAKQPPAGGTPQVPAPRTLEHQPARPASSYQEASS